MKTLQQQHAVNTLIKIFIVPVYNTSLLPYYVTIVKNFSRIFFAFIRQNKTKKKYGWRLRYSLVWNLCAGQTAVSWAMTRTCFVSPSDRRTSERTKACNILWHCLVARHRGGPRLTHFTTLSSSAFLLPRFLSRLVFSVSSDHSGLQRGTTVPWNHRSGHLSAAH